MQQTINLSSALGQPSTSYAARESLLHQSRSYNIYYRPLQPQDQHAIKDIHSRLFPIDYEDCFFQKAVRGEDRVFSWAALCTDMGQEQLVGFVISRLAYLFECDPVDRQYMGLGSRWLDNEMGVYVLTLGVVEGFRHCGIAGSLLGLVQQHACSLRCRIIFLHVITYNAAAIRLYTRSNYQCVGRLTNFYHLQSGRQPDPTQLFYDALLYVHYLPEAAVPPGQWGGVLNVAVAPFRSAWGQINACLPWFCRHSYYHPQLMYQQHHHSPQMMSGPPMPHMLAMAPQQMPSPATASRQHRHSYSGSSSGASTSTSLLQSLFHPGPMPVPDRSR